MTPTQQKAHQLKNDFGELAEKVVDLIIEEFEYNSKHDQKHGYWQQVKNELKKIK